MSNPVVGFAEIVLLTLRANGVEENDILTHFTAPDAEADYQMEARQIAETGAVYAPALAVKSEMRRLMMEARAA